MKTRGILLLALIVFIIASCGKPPQMTVIPTPTWIVGKSDVSWAEVDFKSITPKGIQLDQCWNGMGMDNQGRIYIGFTSRLADKKTEDFVIFRYDPASGKKEFLGTFIDIAKAANNYQEGEEIPKGHTRMIYADGKMYMTSQSFHDLKWQIDSLPLYRGSHLFAYDIASGTWQDLSASLPGGVVTEHEGIVSLNILPQEHLLVGLAHPSSNIVLYDYQKNKLVKIVPGIPWKLGNPLSREIIVAPSGNIYTYRGTEAVSQRNEQHSVWVYNIHTGEMKDTGFMMTKGFWIGQTQTRDGSKIYINTTGGELYEFDVATETFRDLGYELLSTDSRIINYTYTVTLSPDETKLYYVVSVTDQAETTPINQEHDGSEGTGELYYYDLAKGQVVFVEKLPPGIYTSQDLRDNENIYFAHFGGTRDPVFHFVDNLWSGDVHLFILHALVED
ncbi:MAG TPA: hypothetical protein VK206_24690 [Anaerolineales bacterium]|nr:hypothetical protein [Anaerolineales bacterium]